jgi:hypothetical protein
MFIHKDLDQAYILYTYFTLIEIIEIMEIFRLSNKKALLFIVLAVLAVTFMTAGIANAQTTAPISSCAQPNVGGFLPYIYDGELHSFDYIVFDNDRGVVAPIQTVIDGREIETRYSTEWTLNGDTRVHVDVPTWEGFYGTFPVTIHVKTGESASCETQATFNVSLPEIVSASLITESFGTGGPVYRPPSDSSTVPTSVVPSTTESNDESPSVTISVDEGTSGDDTMMEDEDKDFASVISDEGTSDQGAGAKGISALASFFAPITPDGGACKTLPIASWIILSIIHVAIAGAIIFFLRNLISESNLWFTVALLVPFIGFLALWFLFDGCRMHQWFPVVIALVSLGTVLGVPADESPKKIIASTSGGPVMKIPNTPSKNIESPTPKAKKKEEVIKF